MKPMIDKIKDEIRAAKQIRQVDRIARAHKNFVHELLNDDGDMRTMGIQIINLAKYRRKQISHAGRSNS